MILDLDLQSECRSGSSLVRIMGAQEQSTGICLISTFIGCTVLEKWYRYFYCHFEFLLYVFCSPPFIEPDDYIVFENW